jgi:hypothetical protein
MRNENDDPVSKVIRRTVYPNEVNGMVSQNTTVIFEGAFYLG